MGEHEPVPEQHQQHHRRERVVQARAHEWHARGLLPFTRRCVDADPERAWCGRHDGLRDGPLRHRRGVRAPRRERRVRQLSPQLGCARPVQAGGRTTHPTYRGVSPPFSRSSSSGTSRSTLPGADDELPRRDVLRHDRACADERLFADLDLWGEDAPPPTRARRRIVGPCHAARRFSVRPMKLSLVVITHGAMKTSSSSTMYAVMYAFDWILVRRRRSCRSRPAAAPDDPRRPEHQRSRTHDLVADDGSRRRSTSPRRRSRPWRSPTRRRSSSAASGLRFAVDDGAE